MELLELYLSPLDDRAKFKVIVNPSPAGKGETESSLPFIDAQGKDWRATIIRTLEVSSFSAESFSTEEQDWMVGEGILGSDRSHFRYDYLVNIGKALYRSLFPQGSRVEGLLQKSISKSTSLVVRLTLEWDVVKKTRLADYPWELLHDERSFCSCQFGFYRYIADDRVVPPNLPAADKLNVLLVSPAAFDDELGLESFSRKEQKAIRKGLETASRRGDISLETMKKPTLAELRAYLTERPGDKAPHVLHFDGHGLFAKRCANPECRAINKGTKPQRCRKCNTELPPPRGYLIFENENGGPDYISAEELGVLLRQSGLSDGGSQRGGVALAVLSACQSGMAIAGESVFNGAGQNLIAYQVPAVVAMQYSVKVEEATKFAEQFYRSLGQKNSLSVAVSQGRAAMGVEGNQWYRPVLYLRWDSDSGQLFAPSPISPKSRVLQMLAPDIDFSNNYEENSPDLDFSKIPPESIQRAYKKALPPDADLWDDLEENDISQILEILKQHRCEDVFYELLNKDENIALEMRQKIEKEAKKHPEENKPRQAENFFDEKRESYLIATLQRADDEFRLNGWLVIGDSKDYLGYVNNCKSLLTHNQAESGIKCQLDRVESLLDNFIEQCFNFLPKDHQLIIEVFLPIHLLDTKVEWWNFTEFDYKKRPIGTKYSVRLRSVERLDIRYLDRHSYRWKEKWDWVKSVLEKQAILEHFGYFDSAKDRDFTEAYLINQLDDKIGIKLMSCPPEHKRQELFMAIMKSALPIALWSRYSLDNREIEQFFNLQRLCSLCDSIKKKRLEAFAEPNEVLKNKHLGSHLAVIWENPYRLTPDLMELMLPGQ